MFREPSNMASETKKKQILLRIEKWFKGYARVEKKEPIKYYNPFSVIRYLTDIVGDRKIVTPKPYWIKSGVSGYLFPIFSSASRSRTLSKML
jgi:hypothetical protein